MCVAYYMTCLLSVYYSAPIMVSERNTKKKNGKKHYCCSVFKNQRFIGRNPNKFMVPPYYGISI